MTRLAAAVAALRATGDDDAGELADATRLRLRRSLEGRARAHRQLASVIAIVATLLVGGAVSWALSTVHIPFLSSRVEAPAPERAREVPPHTEGHGMQPPVAPRPIAPLPAAPVSPIPAPIAPAPLPPIVPATPPAATSPAPRPAAPIAPATPPAAPIAPVPPTPAPAVAAQLAVIEALYRKAHELHFHGTDYVAALAAWDAYLAAEPTGRFVIEARFNRAIVLVRLGRVAAARAALEPFARGEVIPAGYRREEAERLVRRLGSQPDAPSPPQ